MVDTDQFDTDLGIDPDDATEAPDPFGDIFREVLARHPAEPADATHRAMWLREAQTDYRNVLRGRQRRLDAGQADLAGLLRLPAIDTTPPAGIVAPYFYDEGATTYFGDGGAGKSTIVAALAAAIATEAPITAFPRQGDARPVIVLPYESRRGLGRRLQSLSGLVDPDLIRIVPPWILESGPIWEHADTIRAMVRAEFMDHGAPNAVLVVDSVGIAIGDESASDDTGARLFSGAVERFGLPTLCAAQQTKAGDTMKPFGSNFWHYLNRMTWHVARDAAGVIKLTCRKNNEGELLGEVRDIRVEYDDAGGPVDVVPACRGEMTAAQRYYQQLLITPGLTHEELARAVGSTTETVRTTVNRNLDKLVVDDCRPQRVFARVRG